MDSGFSNKPKILKGALVEYGLTLPPLIVAFEFNPEQLTRNRSLSFSPPTDAKGTMRKFHQASEDLMDIQKSQSVAVEEETISFEIRLEAADKLNDGDSITEEFGVAPQLATLELMAVPKDESLLGAAIGALFGDPGGFSFTKKENPPMLLFIWGHKRVLPVNLSSMNITETAYSAVLNPIRATVAVNLTVIEGPNLAHQYSKAMKEVMSVLNLANIGDVANVSIPG